MISRQKGCLIAGLMVADTTAAMNILHRPRSMLRVMFETRSVPEDWSAPPPERDENRVLRWIIFGGVLS